MKSMVIGGIILIVALMAGTYFVAGDSFQLGEDYINDLTMLAGLAIIGITVFVSLKYINQIKNDTATGELAEENWDGIGEYQNPIPSGWGLMFIGTLIWLMWYWTIGYPTNQFSQIGQWNEETLEHQAKFESKWANISKEDLENMGQSVFLVQCAPCHGVDAEGIEGKAQDLTKRISKSSVLYAIEKGSEGMGSNPAGNWGYPMGMMPPMLVSGADAESVATFIANGMKGSNAVYDSACASCHGPDGTGMGGMAPNLKSYDDTLVAAVLKHGKKSNIGIMPGFSSMLTDTQIKAVGNYLRSIGE
jgi:cytochrome c oxidase cbb3-type subunit 3